MTEAARRPDDLIVFVGTYNTQGTKSDNGLYLYYLDLSTGALRPGGAARSLNPSFLTVDPTQRFLYTVNETMQWDGQTGGGVSAYSLDPQTAEPMLLNQQPSKGGAPCYISIDTARRFAFLVNYGQGNVIMLPILPDGRLAPASDAIQHHGSSANPRRQEGPHTHSIVLDPSQQFALVSDLGTDTVTVYAIDYEHGKLTYRSQWKAQPGAGPRHLTFHPNGHFAYLIQEVNSTITAFAYHSETGTLEELQTVSALPKDFHGESTGAEVRVSPSGKFLYGSNRGADSIVQYAIDEATGKLMYVAHHSSGGRTPRNFTIDPTGTIMLVANQDTSNIVSYHIDEQTGRLQPTGNITQVNRPVCVRIIRWQL